MSFKIFFAAIIFAVVALNFSVVSAAEVPLTSSAAGDIFIALKLDTSNEKFPFTMGNIDAASDESDPNLRHWTCDWIEKSTGTKGAKILFTENQDKHVLAVLLACSLETLQNNETLAETIIALTFSLPSYFGLNETACQKMYKDFMAEPSAGEWKEWDSAHEKCVHVVSMRDDNILGFGIYATDGED